MANGIAPKWLYASHPREEERSVQFVFAQVKYRGGDWDPRPLSVAPLMQELMRRTSIEAATTRHAISLTDPDLFNYPFLYIAGKYDFDPFSSEEIAGKSRRSSRKRNSSEFPRVMPPCVATTCLKESAGGG